MIKNFIRGGISFLGFWIGVGIFSLLSYLEKRDWIVFLDGISQMQRGILTVVCGVVFALLFFLLTPALEKLSSRFAGSIDKDLRRLPVTSLVAGVAGLIIGLVIAYLISMPVARINFMPAASVAVTVAVYIICAWLGVVIGTRKGKDVIAALRSARADIAQGQAAHGQPHTSSREGRKADRSAPKILDTSVIIDGRIADVLKTGFLDGRILIPDFVLVELRHIADSSDSLKRVRGRRGLDILNTIQADFGIEIHATAGDKALADIPEVDLKLLRLAQAARGKIVTNDFNLSKVAQIQGVPVLSINDLANCLKPIVLPGEEMSLYLVKEGKEPGQALAYLDDGTMIVIEDGRAKIGKTVSATVTSVLQTAAGRMIFARLK